MVDSLNGKTLVQKKFQRARPSLFGCTEFSPKKTRASTTFGKSTCRASFSNDAGRSVIGSHDQIEVNREF